MQENVDSATCSYCGARVDISKKDSANTKKHTAQEEKGVEKSKSETSHTNFNFTYSDKRYTERHIDDADTIRAATAAYQTISKEKRKEKEEKRSWMATAILLGISILFLIGPGAGIALHGMISQGMGKVNVGSCEDLLDEDYKTVEAHFRAAGFTDIELIDLDDSGLAFWNEGKVETISIGGKTDFGSLDWFSTDTKVVISYH